MTYKNIVFDIGRVLIDYDWMTMLKDHGLTEQEAWDFASAIFPDPLWKQLDIGILSNDEIVRQYGEKYPQYRELSKWFLDHAYLMPVPRPRVWEKVKALRAAGYKIWLLSNYNEWLFEAHLKDTPITALADGGIISYQIHKIKPEPEIYRALFEKYGLDPAECIFYDDREENVEGAKAVGMDAVQIFSEEQVLEEIGKLLNQKTLCKEKSSYYQEDINMISMKEELNRLSYPGRGIVLGMSEDGKHAAAAYFIMGRSTNSRNRIFVTEGEGIRTEAFDPSRMQDPSLIIYAPVRVLGEHTIVTNGDQTDTIYDGMAAGKSFEESLRSREFEPDAPNYTPRISGVIDVKDGKMCYALSILKSADGDPAICRRYTFTYDGAKAGEGHFIHTYQENAEPLPSFFGEPRQVDIKGDIDAYTDLLWTNLNEDNKVSLFVRFIDLETGKYETRIVNKNQ